MKILAFESSCDETAVAVVEDGRRVLSDAIASQADMHALYGGVVPEIASRKHVEAIAALTDKALADAGVTKGDIDAVAVTYAPGLIGAVLAMWWYTHHFKMDFWQSVELLIPSVPLVHAFGRIGCFCGGCCYGIPFDPPIGIAFTNSPVAPNGIPLFPVQLVEAGLNFLLFFFLLWFAGKPRPQGRILGAYVIAYAVIRFVLEFLRYDYERGILWVFSTSQWISLILLPIGIWLLARRAKAGEKPVSVEPAGAGEAVEKE